MDDNETGRVLTERISQPNAASALPYLTLALAQIAVGAAAIFARYGLSGAAPLAVAASRLAIAAVLLLALAAVYRAFPSGFLRSPKLTIFIAAGIALAIHFASWIWSLQYVSVAVSTLLVATTPIWTAAYDALIDRRSIGASGVAAFAGGAIGLVLVLRNHASAPPIAGHAALGAALALLGALAIAAYFILIRSVRAAFGTRAIVTQTYTVAALALVAAAAIAGQRPPALSDAAAWGGILAMALVSQLLGHTALNAALRWFSASAVAFSTLLEPVIAALLAFWLFRERLNGSAMAGGVLILLAIGTFLKYESQRGNERSGMKPQV